MQIINQKDLHDAVGYAAAHALVGNLFYNTVSKEYGVIADVKAYDNGFLPAVVAFTHGIKPCKFSEIQNGTVAYKHDNRTRWLSDEEAEQYKHYLQEMEDFLAEPKKEEKNDVSVSEQIRQLEILAAAAKAVNSKVWTYEFNGVAGYVIAKTAWGAKRKVMKELKRSIFMEA